MSNDQIRYEPTDDERLSEAVVAAIGEKENANPLDIEPLYEYIDLGALDSLFDAPADPSAVEFSTSDHRVTVTAQSVRVESASAT